MSGDIAAGGGGIDLSRLISAISPILLGTGKTNAGNNTTSTSGSDQTQTTTTQKNADPGTLAALLGIAQNASDRSQNPDITNNIVNQIFRQSAEAFAPTVGASASTGLYNTSTLGLLSDNARANATAQAASAVLNFQTSQQQIAAGALSNILGATGSTTSTTSAKNQTATAGTGNSFTITAPSLTGSNLLQSAGGLAASILGKKAFDVASPFLQAHLVDPIKNALGFGDVGTLSSKSDFLGAAVPDSIAEGQGKILNAAAPTITTSTSGLDISDTPGANFTTSAEGDLSAEALASANGLAPGTEAADIVISGAENFSSGANLIPGTAEALSAPTVDIAAATAPDIGATAGSITPEIGTAVSDTSNAVEAGIGSSLSNASGVGTAGLEGSISGVGTAGEDVLSGAGGSGLVNDISGFIDGAGNFIGDAANGIGNFIGDAFSNSGDLITGGIASLGLGEAFKGIFGPEVGGDLSLGTSGASFLSGQLGGPTISSLASDALGAGAGALGFGAASGAGLEAAGGFSTLGALEGAADAAPVFSSATTGILDAVFSGSPLASGFVDAVAGVGSAASLLSLAGIGGFIGDATLAGFGAAGGAIGAEAASAAIAAGGTEAALAVGSAAEAGIGIETVLEAGLALLAWIICTELKVQGKMNATLYRYGLKKYLSYPEWGRYGYLLWAIPTVKHMRKYPNSLVTRFMSWVFNLRINNIAANEGCKIAKWTYRGLAVSLIVELISCILGIIIIPLRTTTMSKKNWSV